MAAWLSIEIKNALERGMTILSANQRVAQTIEQAFDEAMRAQQKTVWERSAVFPVEAWLSAQWRRLLVEGFESKMLLNQAQEHMLWRDILATDAASHHPGLRSIDSLASTAARAWQTVCRHNGRSRVKEFGISIDTRAFERWALEFERVCRRNGYVTRGQLPTALEATLARGELTVPNSGFFLVNMDALPPALQQFFDSIKRAGYTVDRLRHGGEPDSAYLHAAPDERSELRAAVRWVREKQAAKAGARIAIVTTNLAERQLVLERALLADDARMSEPDGPSARDQAIASFVRRPLAEVSLVAVALDLLRWTFEPLPLATISAFLLSPSFGSLPKGTDATEARQPSLDTLAVAAFDAFELHRIKRLRPELSLAAMVAVMDGSRRRAQLLPLLNRLKDMQRAVGREQMSLFGAEASGAKQSYSEWTNVFRRVLDAAGWPRAAFSDLPSQQAAKRWDGVLEEMETLVFAARRVSAATAHETLTRMLQETVFSCDSHDAAVQILGPDELGGTTYDALWLLGADDSTWPPTPALNPLLSLSLQRALGVPGAVIAQDRQREQALTQRIARSAQVVVFSYAKHAEDGERRPSPLLEKLGLMALPFVDHSLERVARTMETVLDDQHLPPLPEHVHRGGAQILQAQAACGFRAFAEWRLSSSQPEIPELGMNARERGSLVHLVMEDFWGRVHDQSTLQAMPREARRTLLTECIDAALDKAKRTAESAWDLAYIQTQKQRLIDLLQPWLELELERPAFQVRERERDSLGVTIGPLKLTVRVDRIDETADGSLILDYKTGAADPADWLSERPDAPQLPLYAVLAEPEHLGGVAFALLRAGEELGLKGFADSKAVLRRSSTMDAPSLADQVFEWRRVLTNLSAAFAEGDVAVAPKRYPQTCKYCAQRILCRLDPTTLEDYGDDEDGMDLPLGLGEGMNG